MISHATGMRYSAFGLALCSAGFTAYFGWTAGGSIWWACLAGALAGIFISIISPLLWFSVGLAGPHKIRAGILGIFAALFLFIDAITNIGSLFSMRQAEIVGSQYQTSLATDARAEIERLEGRISDMRQRALWRTDWLAPEAYDAEILKLKNETENGRNIWQRSKQCTDTTVATSQRVCQAIATAEANKKNALEREKLKEEIKVHERELADAKALAHDTPPKVSAAWTQVEKLAALATLDIDPSQTTKESAYLLITGLFGLVTSIGAAVLSWALGCSPTHGHSLRSTTAPVAQSPYLPNHTQTPNQFVPQNHSSSRETTIVVPGGFASGDSIQRLDAVRERCNAFLARMEAA